MKRTDITAIFPNATDDQVKKLMDINGSDVNEAKKGGEDVKKQLFEALAALDAAKKASEGAPSADDLAKAKQKTEDLEKELTEMKHANQLRELRETVAKEKGVPASLLTGETGEACKAQADGILEFSKSQTGYQQMHDGGEAGGGAGQQSTRDQFAAWAKDNL